MGGQGCRLDVVSGRVQFKAAVGVPWTNAKFKMQSAKGRRDCRRLAAMPAVQVERVTRNILVTLLHSKF
jgi:hypothetical protein